MKIVGLYVKRGWYYYQPPMVSGKRPPAIALKTKDPDVAVNEAFALHTSGAMGRQSKERMDYMVEIYLMAQRDARVHTAKTSDSTGKVLKKLSKQWGNPPVRSIDRKRIEAWRSELQARPGMIGETLSDASVDTYLRRLSGFLSWLVDNKHIRRHPMDGVRLGRVKKTRRQKFCTIDEREKLLGDPPSDEIDFILHFGFFAGLRFGEILAMEKSWFVPKGEGMLLTVQETKHWKPKGKECRSIEMHPRLIAFLERYGMKEPFMFAPRKWKWKDEPAYRFNPKKAFKSHVAKHDLSWVSYHTLRHSFASHLAMSGATIAEIADALGDSIKVAEENYVGLLPARRSTIAAI